MLRRFVEDESNTYVGKMIVLLINHMKTNSLDKSISQEDINKLYELGQIKLGKSKMPTNQKETQKSENKVCRIDFEYFKKALLNIEKKHFFKFCFSIKKSHIYKPYVRSLEKAACIRLVHEAIERGT